MHGEAASGSRASPEVPTVERRPFAHPNQPVADLAPRWYPIPFRSVVEYLHFKFCQPVVEPNVRRCRYRVLTGVGQRLLNVPWLASKHIHPHILSHNVGVVLLGGIAATALYAVVGVGVGSLIRNQMAAVGVALGWALVAESLLIGLAHEIGRWTPGAAAAALDGVSRNGPLPMWGGAVLFTAYGVAFATAGTRFTIRRDGV
jgi:hypothetical protein